MENHPAGREVITKKVCAYCAVDRRGRHEPSCQMAEFDKLTIVVSLEKEENNAEDRIEGRG